MNIRNILLSALGVIALSAVTALGIQKITAPADGNGIETTIHDYIVANPEVLVEAMAALEEKRRATRAEAAVAAVADNAGEIFNDPLAPVFGNPEGDVNMVEFFDYRCGYCKKVFPDVMQTIKDDGGVRLIFKEFPILGPESVAASRAALASRKQGKYFEFHNALMAHKGAFGEAEILTIAGEVGLDTEQLKTDMGDREIDDILSANRKLADALNITGTPGFVIGKELVPGAISLDQIKNLIAQARDVQPPAAAEATQ